MLTRSPKFRFLDNLDSDLQQNVLNQLRILWTHHSTAIEGNTLSLGDTKFLIEEGLTIAGKTIKEHNEVMGHVKAIDMIYSLLEKEQISEIELFNLHMAVQTDQTYDVYNRIGKWKKEINGVNIIINNNLVYREFPQPDHIPYLMNLWIKKFGTYAEILSLEDLIKIYAAMHISFVCIHPFFDGNGRIARLISNYHLLKAGFPPIIISKENRQKYLQILSSYQSNSEKLNDKSTELIDCENEFFKEFLLFCKSEYQIIVEIINSANKMQEKRKKENIY